MSKKKKIDTKHLFQAVCHLNVVPVWYAPSEDSGMISQMLFGETCMIIQKKNKHWYKVSTTVCNIVGWVHSIQLFLISEGLFEKLNQNPALSLEICHSVFNDDNTKSIVIGSSLPQFDGISFQMPDNKYIFNGQAALVDGLETSPELLIKIARRYMFSPELKGGRSPFGIDAGAFVQNVFRFFGILMPRFPHEQFLIGEVVDFAELSQEGDVAFYEDKEGHIEHAGIIIGDKKVIHVYGCVRIDKFDHHGIYNTDLRRYTHKLRIIKRIL